MAKLNDCAKFCPITVEVRGTVAFSRIASPISGEELKKDQQRREQQNRPVIEKPYTTITIEDPQIIGCVPNDQPVPDVIREILTERFITREVDGVMKTRYYAINKSPYLPQVGYSAEAGDLRGKIIANNDMELPGELATGMRVSLGVRLYVGKLNNVGIGFNFVMLHEPIRLFAKSGIEQAMIASGLTPQQPTAPVQLQEAAVETPAAPKAQPIAQNATPVSVSPMAQPDPQAAPAPAPAPVMNQPVPPQAQAQAEQAQANPMVGSFPQGGANFTDPNMTVPNLQYTPQ